MVCDSLAVPSSEIPLSLERLAPLLYFAEPLSRIERVFRGRKEGSEKRSRLSLDVYSLEARVKKFLVDRERRLLRAEIERQTQLDILAEHDKHCACWACIGRLQAWIIETIRGEGNG